ncbi:MAG TPA: ABC transporter ATP-binding protein [Pirellulales bacterium]
MSTIHSSDPETSSSTLALTARMLRLAWRHRWGCCTLLAQQIALLALALAGLGLTGLAIDVIRHEVDTTSPAPDWPRWLSQPVGWSALAQVLGLAGLVLLLASLRAVLNYFHAVASARLVQQQIVVELRAAIYEKLHDLSSRFFRTNSTTSIINRVTSDAQSVRQFVEGMVLQLVILLLSLTVYLTYMLRIHAGLSLACLATMPVLWFVAATFCRVVRPAYDHNRTLMDRLIQVLSENVRGMRVVRGFAREADQIQRFRRANDDVQAQQKYIFWRLSLFTPTSEFLSTLNLAVLLGYGGYLVTTDGLPLGAGLIVFSGLLQQFSGQVSKMVNVLNSMQQSLAGARRVFEVLDAPVEIHSPPFPRRLPTPRGSITFENVSFHYQAGEPVLSDVDLRIRPGQRVAILGATGCGKSSLLHLVPRFCDPGEGRVLVDGIDVRALALEDLRRAVGLVFQETFLFSDTVAANIAFGHPQATREQIERAAKIAAADQFIRQLPDGYDTWLAEEGSNLSGGQRQRLAIARAVLLEPPILLLDDPTAAVDAQTEHEILEAIDRAMQGRTSIIVTHRPAVLQRADLVLVMDQGCIVEAGSHDELSRCAGHYCQVTRLHAEQAACYA